MKATKSANVPQSAAPAVARTTGAVPRSPAPAPADLERRMQRALRLGHRVTDVPPLLPLREADPDSVQLSPWDRIKSGFGIIPTGVGALAAAGGYALLASNPVGWAVTGGLAAGALVTGAASYLRGSDPSPEVEVEAEKDSDTESKDSVAGPTKDEQWKEVQADRAKYDQRLLTLVGEVQQFATTRLPAVRTLYRRIIDRQPLMLEINQESRGSIDSWRGEIPITTVRNAYRNGQNAIKAYEDFIALIDQLSDSAAVESPTKKQLFKSGAFKQLIASRAQDLERRAKALEEITARFEQVAPVLEAQETLEDGIRTARRLRIRTGETAGEAHTAVGADAGGGDWFATTYPNGWVHLAGNAYAAIMPQAVTALGSGAALTMFQEALNNGTISDYGTGASGVKWGKRELKVRRTRLEAIQVAGDTRLTGPVVDVPRAVGGPDRAIRVLQLTTVTQAH
jgi:hypothetical protein